MKLTVQFGLLVFVLFFGVLLGIDTAEKGIYRIEGAPSGMVTPALEVTPKDDGALEVAVLGKKYKADQAMTKVNEVKSTTSELAAGAGNQIGRLGILLGNWLKETTRIGLEWIF